MNEKTCLITGANTGIGLETARELARRGATVVLCARDRVKGEAAVAEVRQSTGNERVELLMLDLASLASIREGVEVFRTRHPRLDILVNNAGLILSERRVTADGFEMTFGVNHLGHFLLTHLLGDALGPRARVVTVSSALHAHSPGLDFDDLMRERRPYAPYAAYNDSKLANVLFTRELGRRLASKGAVAHAVHPGVVRSGFGRDGDVGGVLGWIIQLAAPFLLSPAKGARTSVHVATSDDALASSGDYWVRARRAKPGARALDDAAAKRLWDVSEALVGLR